MNIVVSGHQHATFMLTMKLSIALASACFPQYGNAAGGRDYNSNEVKNMPEFIRFVNCASEATVKYVVKNRSFERASVEEAVIGDCLDIYKAFESVVGSYVGEEYFIAAMDVGEAKFKKNGAAIIEMIERDEKARKR